MLQVFRKERVSRGKAVLGKEKIEGVCRECQGLPWGFPG